MGGYLLSCLNQGVYIKKQEVLTEEKREKIISTHEYKRHLYILYTNLQICVKLYIIVRLQVCDDFVRIRIFMSVFSLFSSYVPFQILNFYYFRLNIRFYLI